MFHSSSWILNSGSWWPLIKRKEGNMAEIKVKGEETIKARACSIARIINAFSTTLVVANNDELTKEFAKVLVQHMDFTS